ncbi:hypothetical protein B0H15DRAFT_956837 [Mycena belliarum]|uniref:Uncharacterized protein n=1 Tax=Mycena belliarum TaxID=1033014 RepID=A0AAD6XEV0_9AGAR|nr:hypothetical protein B0H15DRAFT_956837 [Mycena belliae]
MALDMNNPAEHQRAMDRRTAGVGPLMGPTESRRKVRELRLQRIGDLEIRRQNAASAPFDDLLEQMHPAMLQGRDTFNPIDKLKRYSSASPDLDSAKNFRQIPERPRAGRTKAQRRTQGAVDDDSDDEETKYIAQAMLDQYIAHGTDPLETMLEPCESDEMSSSEEDNSGLPYVPRPKIHRRRVLAVLRIQGQIAQIENERHAAERAARTLQYATRDVPWLHARTMKRVMAEVRTVGTSKKAAEREEKGPAPCGFSYIQVE